jgi:tRNA(Ile)-lysidine synthase
LEHAEDQFENLEIPGEDFLVWIDRKAIEQNALMRPRQEGDEIRPLGMGGGSMKVSDLMINEKIPAPYRADWPIITDGDNVLWVPGGRLSQEASITGETQAIVELKFIRKK